MTDINSTNSARNSVNVVSYNVLSSHLASSDYLTKCEPKFLNANYRLNLMKQKLSEKMASGSVICLQEISTTWASPLHTFCLENGYYFISSHYGTGFNGYMGCAVAFPMSKYNLLDVDITCIADTKNKIRRPKPGLSYFSLFNTTTVPFYLFYFTFSILIIFL